MRKALFMVSAASLAFLLTSCFVMQGFSLLAGAVDAGGKTKAQFVQRPLTTAEERDFQFVVVGVPDDGNLTIGSATWDVKGAFSGPVPMAAVAGLPAAMATVGTCTSSGLAFESITGTTWKAFMTPTKVRTQGLVDTSTISQVVVKATAGATTGTNYNVFGVAGVWYDDGDGGVDVDDTFACSGIASAMLYVRA